MKSAGEGNVKFTLAEIPCVPGSNPGPGTNKLKGLQLFGCDSFFVYGRSMVQGFFLLRAEGSVQYTEFIL